MKHKAQVSGHSLSWDQLMLTADQFRAKYQMLQKVAEGRIITYQAKDQTGRLVMVHILERGATPANNQWLALLDRLATQETLVLERVEVNGQPVVVTPILESFESLPAWLENRARAAPDKPATRPPPAAPPSPAADQAPAAPVRRQPVEPPPLQAPPAARPPAAQQVAPSPGPSESRRAGSDHPAKPTADPYVQSLPYEVVGRRPIRALVDFIRRRGFILFLVIVAIWLVWFA